MVGILLGLVIGTTILAILYRIRTNTSKFETTEMYTCTCGSGTHLWLAKSELECNGCGRVKEVGQNGIIVTLGKG